MVLGVAIIGAGRLVRDQILAGIQSSPDLELRAIWSLTMESANAILPGQTLGRYAEHDGTQKLDDLLKREDIEAVIVAVPVFAQHDYITTALESSKHVLSERPIIKAKDETLVTWYYSWCPVTWCVAENFRHWESVDYALSKLEQLGEIRHCGIHLNLDVGPGSPYWKYFDQETPANHVQHLGRFLLDVGVHFAAVARTLLRGRSIENVLALGEKMRGENLPIDTLDGLMKLKDGGQGILQMSASSSQRGTGWTITGEHGSISILDMKGGIGQMTVTTVVKGEEEVRHFSETDLGVGAEVRAWGASLAQHRIDKRGLDQQGPMVQWADLEVIDLMLKSCEERGNMRRTEHQAESSIRLST